MRSCANLWMQAQERILWRFSRTSHCHFPLLPASRPLYVHSRSHGRETSYIFFAVLSPAGIHRPRPIPIHGRVDEPKPRRLRPRHDRLLVQPSLQQVCAIRLCLRRSHQSATHYISSCVHSIQNAVSSLSPAPTSVEVSIVTQTVTVRHPKDLSRAAIDNAIEEAGFDIVSGPEDNDLPRAQSTPLASFSLSQNLTRLGTPFTPIKQRHLAQCAACQADQRASLERGVESSTTLHEEKSSPSHDGEIYLPSQQKAEMPPASPTKPERSTAASAVSDDHCQQQVTLSIGGMTCASCSSAVTDALSELPGVSEVVVNLLGNSATLTIERADLVPTVTETVEDIGYEAEVISVEPFIPAAPKAIRTTEAPQRVTLSVGGMTCVACSNTVTDVLKGVPGVSNPIVNLLGASATLVVESRDIIPQVVESIEDAGYEAEVVNTEPMKPEKGGEQEIGPRNVALRVDGLFCRCVHSRSNT